MKFTAGLVTLPLLLILAGCGGGAGSVQPLTIRSAGIATFGQNTNAATTPFTSQGGAAEISVYFLSPSGIAPNSVVIDVKDASGKLIISGGPRNISLEPYPTPSYTDQYLAVYGLTVPANTTTQTEMYTATVTASDNAGHKITPPATVGTISVPGV